MSESTTVGLVTLESTLDGLNLSQLPAPLAGALIDAQGRVARVAKDARNNYAKYDYASAEDMIDEARAALNGAGLALMSSWRFESDASGSRERKVDDGRTLTVGPIGRVVVPYTLIHASGECVSFSTSTPVIPEKGRPEDKAELSALTANLAYTLRNLLLIPRGDAPGDAVDQRNDNAYEPQTQQRRPPTQRREQTSDQGPVDDVPFQVGPNDSAAMSRSPNPTVRRDNPDLEIVTAVIAGMGEVHTLSGLRAGLEQSHTLPLSDESVLVVEQACAVRMMAVAASLQELAEVLEFVKAMRTRGAGDDAWHSSMGTAYKARRAALNPPKAS